MCAYVLINNLIVLSVILLCSKTKNVLVRLSQIAKKCVKQTGFFVHMPRTVSKEFWEAPEWVLYVKRR